MIHLYLLSMQVFNPLFQNSKQRPPCNFFWLDHRRFSATNQLTSCNTEFGKCTHLRHPIYCVCEINQCLSITFHLLGSAAGSVSFRRCFVVNLTVKCQILLLICRLKDVCELEGLDWKHPPTWFAENVVTRRLLTSVTILIVWQGKEGTFAEKSANHRKARLPARFDWIHQAVVKTNQSQCDRSHERSTVRS